MRKVWLATYDYFNSPKDFMGYYLHAFICRKEESTLLCNHFDKAQKVEIGQGVILLPMTEELFDQINNFSISPAIDKFEYLTENIEREILRIITGSHYAYVEAEYHGGQGGQLAIIWNKNHRESFLEYEQQKINRVLKGFGVQAEIGKDEFDTLGLGRYRNTMDWIEKTD